MIQNVSNKLGDYIAKQANSPEQGEVIAYGLQIVLGSLVKIILIVSISAALNVFYETLTIIIFSAVLRSLSGGVHCSSYNRCLITSLVVFSSLGLLTKKLVIYFDTNSMILLLVLGVVLLMFIWYFWIPTGSVNRPLQEQEKRLKFKSLSLVVIILHFLVSLMCLIYWREQVLRSVLCSSVGLVWQAFTVTPLGFYFITKCDLLFNLTKGGDKREKNV